jgi:hypothetical protein
MDHQHDVSKEMSTARRRRKPIAAYVKADGLTTCSRWDLSAAGYWRQNRANPPLTSARLQDLTTSGGLADTAK